MIEFPELPPTSLWLQAVTLVIPFVNVTDQVKFPVGALAFVAPVTVAVMRTEPPRTGEAGLAVKTTVGVAGATTVLEVEEVSTTGRYEVSPAKMKLAP